MTLETLGWNDRLAQSYEAFASPEREPARVLRADREQYHVQGAGVTHSYASLREDRD